MMCDLISFIPSGMAPPSSIHRVGWGGTWAFKYRQAQWVREGLTPEQQEVLSPPSGKRTECVPFHM
jgi:hypothetical protein